VVWSVMRWVVGNAGLRGEGEGEGRGKGRGRGWIVSLAKARAWGKKGTRRLRRLFPTAACHLISLHTAKHDAFRSISR
jgi:hypothetical protein